VVKAYCSFRQVPSAAKSLSLFAGFTLFNRIGKSGAEIFSPTPLYCFFYFCVLLFLYLHRLVGLRLLRLCLKLRQGFALYPQGTLSLDPASPLTPGLSLRFISRYARCWVLCSVQLCQFLTPHSSLTSFLTYDIASSISFTSSPNIASASLIGCVVAISTPAPLSNEIGSVEQPPFRKPI